MPSTSNGISIPQITRTTAGRTRPSKYVSVASLLARSNHRTLILSISRLTGQRVLPNISWTFVGNALYAACQWAMVVVLARSTNPNTVGVFALALAITAPVISLFNMQLRSVIATDVIGSYRLRQYGQMRLLSAAAALVVIALCLTVIRESPAAKMVIMVIALSKAAESMSDIIHGYWQLLERMDIVGTSLTIRALLTLVLFTGAMIWTRTLVWGALAFLAGSLGVLVAYDLPQLRRALSSSGNVPGSLVGLSFATVRKTTGRSLVRHAMPLGFAAMVISLNSAIPRYFIQRYCGTQQLGIFAALSYSIVVGNLCMNAVGQSVLPRLAKSFTHSHKQFRQLFTALVACSGVVAAVSLTPVLMFGRRFLGIYGREYADAYPVFLIIMAAASVGYGLSVFNFSLIAIGAYRIQAPMVLSVALVLAVCCRIWTPAYGIGGAALALLVCNVIQAAMSVVILASLIRKASRTNQCATH